MKLALEVKSESPSINDRQCMRATITPDDEYFYYGLMSIVTSTNR